MGHGQCHTLEALGRADSELTLPAADPNSSVPARIQSVISGPASILDAFVWATMPGSGSQKTCMVAAAWRMIRPTICSVSVPVCFAISAKDTRPPGGTRPAMPNRAMVCRHADLSLYYLLALRAL